MTKTAMPVAPRRAGPPPEAPEREGGAEERSQSDELEERDARKAEAGHEIRNVRAAGPRRCRRRAERTPRRLRARAPPGLAAAQSRERRAAGAAARPTEIQTVARGEAARRSRRGRHACEEEGGQAEPDLDRAGCEQRQRGHDEDREGRFPRRAPRQGRRGLRAAGDDESAASFAEQDRASGLRGDRLPPRRIPAQPEGARRSPAPRRERTARRR